MTTQATQNPNHMEVSGNEWEQWKAQIWNSMADRFGYPGLAPLEQWMKRSHSETRCVECGDPGTAEQTSVLVASVDTYFMCEDCDAYWQSK